MKITVSIDSKQSIEIGYAELSEVLFSLSDNPSSADFFNRLASHPVSEIRAIAADKTCLSVATLERLANDPSIDVVQRVAHNDTALKSFKADTFKTMIGRDVSIALDLARYYHSAMRPSVSKAVKAELLKHEDPSVRNALAAAADARQMYA